MPPCAETLFRRLLPRACLCLALAAAPARALSPLPEHVDPRVLAMGGAARSTAEPVSAARVNPAALARRRGFFSAVHYGHRQTGSVNALSVVLVDNITSPLGGAIQYLHFQGEQGQERDDLSLGLAWGKKGLWWGATARLIRGQEPGQAGWDSEITADVGLLFERPSGIRIAVVGSDVLGTSLGFVDRRIALGVSTPEMFGWTLAADVVRNLDRRFSEGVDLHLGAEYVFERPALAVRFGQMWRGDTGKDYASAGVAWRVGRFTLEYGVQKARQRSGEWLHALGVEAPL
ncbi:MAG: hypothetical protein Kow0092_32700 [Deferrisomatales bacterium]